MQKLTGKMKIVVLNCNIFEPGYLACCSITVIQNSYSDISNPFGGKSVSEF